jgi:uncharacterized Zn finger protein
MVMSEKPGGSGPFTDLAWDDLEKWAGTRTLSRGKRYQREGRVRELACSPNGELVAWVTGNEKYATVVTADGGFLRSWCTCPVRFSCKHAVAVVLEYLESLKKDDPIKILSGNDPRLPLLGISSQGAPVDSPFSAGFNQTLITDPGQSGNQPGTQLKEESLRTYLEGLTREELVDLLDELSQKHPPVRRELSDRRSIAAADAGPVVEALLSDIDSLTDEPAWSNQWTGEGSIPDYSSVQEGIETLLSTGFAEEVIRIGEVLLEKGTAQVEASDDEGETAMQIASCMDVVFSALSISSRPPHERMLFAVGFELKDEYDLCAGAEKFWEEKFSQKDWGLLADKLLKRLKENGSRPDTGDFSLRYKRDRLVERIVAALDAANRHDEATALCIAEADKTDNYARLVKRLIHDGRKDEAMEWISQGISRTGKQFPGIAAGLRTILREMRENEGDWMQAASMRAEDFFREPTISTFRSLEAASKRAGVWNEVRDAAMQYLVSGTVPAMRPATRAENGVIPGILPDTGVTDRESRRVVSAPVFETLIDIAIAEKKPDEVIRWYDRWIENRPGHWLLRDREVRVADAVAETYPERALAIWRMRAEALVAEIRPKSYESAAGYLKKIRSLMKKQDREEEWGRFIGELRSEHSRKKRFIEVLDGLEGRRIIG